MKKKPDFTKPVDIKAYLFDIFNLCGCIELDMVIEEIKKILLWASINSKERISYNKLYESKGCFYIITGILDNEDILNHGISIRYARITDNGRFLLKSLNKYTVDDICDATGIAYNNIEFK